MREDFEAAMGGEAVAVYTRTSRAHLQVPVVVPNWANLRAPQATRDRIEQSHGAPAEPLEAIS